MTVSTSQPKLSEALANVGLSSGSMTDRRVREQLGGRQSNGYSLMDLRGALVGQYSALTGGWNVTPQANGYMYRGYDNNAGLSDGAEITFHDSDRNPGYRSVRLMGNSPGGSPLPNDKTIEVRCVAKIDADATYRFEVDLKCFSNGFYNNTYWALAIAGSSFNYLQGITQLDYYDESTLINSISGRTISVNVPLKVNRPYISMILYMYFRQGGSPSAPPEGVEYSTARLYKI